MKKTFRILIPVILLVLGAVYACNKAYLTKPAIGSLSLQTLANSAGVNSLLIGAYSMLDEQGGAVVGLQFGNGPDKWVWASVCADDSYKGSTPSDQGDITPLETWSVATANNGYVEAKWQALYDGIQRSNDVIRTLAVAPDVTGAAHGQLLAEARMLRGYYHMEGIKLWGPKFPYVSERVDATVATTIKNDVPIWDSVTADIQFAIDSLAVQPADIGRFNKYAAEAFMAEFDMMQYNYTAAKTLLDDLLTNGVNSAGVKYDFNPGGYFNNFNPDPGAKNSDESVFSVQMSVNDGSGTNGNYGDVLNFPNDGSGPGGCCGFNNPSVNLANAYKTDANGLPLFTTAGYTFNNGTAVINSSYTGNLDPRIDFAMGRPGISYLDFGVHPGALWVRDGTDGYFSPKKNVYALSQKNVLSSKETQFWGPTQIVANNVNVIRYSGLLLMAAECEVEIGDPAKALTYVNMVRNRVAARPETWTTDGSTFDASTYTYKDGTPYSNYKIGLYATGAFADKAYAIRAVRFERRLELAFEGYRFFDLQRWNFDPTYPEDMSVILNNYATVEKTRPSNFAVNQNATFHKGVNEYFPIPQTEIDLLNVGGAKLLVQNPGY